MGRGDTNLLIEAIRKSTRFLHRDYFELEGLQSLSKNCDAFVKKSCHKLYENLVTNIQKYHPQIFYSIDDFKESNFTGSAALIEILDGTNNLTRSLPYFASIVTIVTKKGSDVFAEKIIINFPALNELYYAEKGKGAWVEKYSSNYTGKARVRVSGVNDINSVTLATNLEQITEATNITKNIRVFNSYAYSIALLIAGKIDVCLFEKRDISYLGINLIIQEAGGITNLNDSNIVIGSNYHISDKIKHLI
ncbi:MAG: inositol monophosphatase [Rickettsiaceae bacterium]|nr:inositol monophosphatase [Rickettsiaceae bacterium]